MREFDPTPVLEELGQRFEVERTSLKPFPTCRFTHAPIAALQEVMQAQGLSSNDLEWIEARVTRAAYAEVCEPLADKIRPKSRVHAQFSLPYALACVAHHGTATLDDLTEEGIRRESVLEIADRVRCVRDAGLEARWCAKIGEGEVRVRTRDGVTLTARALPPGRPERPVTETEFAAKLKGCLAWGSSGLERSALMRTVESLRHGAAVSVLSQYLGGGGHLTQQELTGQV